MIGSIKRLSLKNYGQRGPIYLFSLVIFFWTIFDTIMTYITPLLIERNGFSNTLIGLIIGSSSIAGGLFDFIICKVFKNTHFRRVFLIMFALCFIYPILLWQAKTFWFFIFVMAVWGIYFDLYGFGAFDFIGRHTKKAAHAASFGLIQMFRALADIIAPLIIGLIIVVSIDWRTIAFGWLFLAIGFILFVILLVLMRKHPTMKGAIIEPVRRKNLFIELHLWRKLGTLMMPVLFMTFYLFFIEAFFWTLAPLYAEDIAIKHFGGLFLAAYTLPALIVGWFISPLTKHFGKKRIALLGLLIGSLILSSFYYLSNPIIAIVAVFIASCFISMALPAIDAAYTDYISEAPQVEGEIESLEDFAFNMGYVVGPILAGVLADILSMAGAFSMLGLFGVILAIILLIITPRKITVITDPSEL